MKLTPKVTKQVNAIRLKKQLVASAGDWLIIGEDDSIEVVTDLYVKQMFNVNRGEKPARQSPENFSRIARESYRLTVGGKELKVGSQLGRVLVGFFEADMGHGAFSSQIKRHLNELDGQSMTARLSDATKYGFVEAVKSERDPEAPTGFLWKLTNNGREIARQIKKQQEAA